MISEIDVDDFLEHFGVKGQKWGVRNDRETGVSKSTSREAKKDAGEFARAKMFFGEGAGTRRKLIKAKVESKSGKDPDYKKAFDHHLSNQDLGAHASKARSERRRKDATSKTTKTARGVHRQLTGGFGSVSLASALIAGAYVGARKSGVDKQIMTFAKTKISDIRRQNSPLARDLKNFFDKQGFRP